MTKPEDVDRAPVHAVVNQRFLLTKNAVYVYFENETWSVSWWGNRWSWLPGWQSGMCLNGWMFDWFGILIERFVFDDDESLD